MNEREKFIEILNAKGLSERTVELYLYYYDALQKVLQGSGRDLDQEVLNVFVNAYKSTPPCRAFLKIYLAEEERADLILPQRTGSREKKKRQFISRAEIKLMGNALLEANRIRYFLMLHLTYECALRRKEVLNIYVQDFNWETWLEDPEKKGKLKITILGAKRKRERYVIVPAWLMKALYAYIAEIKGKLDDEDPLFQIQKDRWHKIFKQVARGICKRNYTLHDLRFSRATQWYKEGKDIRKIQIRLGHSNIQTTMRYIDPAEEEELEAWADE